MGRFPVTGAIDVISEPDVAAQDLEPRSGGCARRRVLAFGVVSEVSYPPATEQARFRALLKVAPTPATAPGGHDLELLWQGRRSVPGVTAGTRLRCLGVVCFPDGVATMYNPRYEIVSTQRTPR